jgi:membrane protease YdiL (CAAX protease family)
MSRAIDRFVRDRALTSGLVAALVAFALTFRGPRRAFWQRMTMTGLVLGGIALRTQPELRRTRIGPKDLAQGVGSAAALYGVFQVGDRLARRVLPMGAAQIESIYDLRTLRPRPEIAARLVAVIGPAEELFWRGLVQGRLAGHYGRTTGAVLATAAYGGAHIVTGNVTLIGAATVAGAFWGLLAATGVPMGALIVSHVAWDLWIFLVSPTVRE